MLKTIHLQNFRQHTDLKVDFMPGMNAIRAANEAGKSTLLEAIAYALFGTKGLLNSIDEVVTWHVPVKSLKVTLQFEVLGVDYVITRSNSSAEINWSGGKVTNQSEVTKFVEQLLGANAAMAAKLMLAPQGKLRGALDEGPTGAGQMIESLADFDLLDVIIDLIQEHLPYGDVASTTARITLLREQAAPSETEDLTPLEAEVTASAAAVSVATQAVQAKQVEIDGLDLAAARQIIADEQALRQQQASGEAKIEALRAALEAKIMPAPDEAEIERVRALVAKEKDVASALAVRAELARLPEPFQWDQPLDTLLEELRVQTDLHRQHADIWKESGEAARAVDSELTKARAAYQLAHQKLEGQMIRESACGLCGKDLADVPEVVTRNAALQLQMDGLTAAWGLAEAELKDDWATHNSDAFEAEKMTLQVQEYLTDLHAVLAAHERCELLYARAGDSITLDRSGVPARWTWAGPEAGGSSLAPKLAELVADAQRFTTETARRAQQEEQLQSLRIEQTELQARYNALPLVDAQETIELHEKAVAALKPLQAALELAKETLHQKERLRDNLVARAEAAAAARQQAVAQLAAAEQELADKEANNLLLKTVRGARPEITDKLWNMALSAVSQHFTQVRGETSIITRGDGGFLCNGQPVQGGGLSGSAKDVLGLSIRVALTKIFLPTAPFLILDEAAAACDGQRETAMLGLLSVIGFDQIILVTHSALADAHADHIINL